MTKFRVETSGEKEYLVIENYHVNRVGRAKLLSKKYLRLKEGESGADAIKRYEVEESKRLSLS